MRGDDMKAREQKNGENREDYVKAARDYARRKFNALRNEEYAHCHKSHAVSKALELTEKRFTDLEAFGVEGDCELNGENHIDIMYLNMGDSYALTIVYWQGRFLVTSWGDVVESTRHYLTTVNRSLRNDKKH